MIQLKSYGAYCDVKIMLAIPFEGHNESWTNRSSERLKTIIKHSEEVVIVSDSGEAKQQAYRKRNQYMVDKADCLLAVFDKRKIRVRSGTNMTLVFALKKQIPVIVIDCSQYNE
ncbi:SLOG family protein [Clostridium sp. MD294]|uniref:SLOG family protein n=1 Tax=Clostridium sp. MD294 TaxID=97138 RepID=UPI0002CC55E8|nr:SLOG family protein [Clostridium sp. MD294]NDO47210.1 DUF1273 family protein [Clostridium sp. MD294]USF29726.1 hypothetical protein C820_001128 [Clostridium sp. MD294]